MSTKVKVNLTIRKEVVEKAKNLGLNLSQFCENALKEAIEALEQRKIQTETNGGNIDTRSVSHRHNWWGRPDSNRGPESPSLRA
jgi:post-segregation antitoxin (ccd killing protein)